MQAPLGGRRGDGGRGRKAREHANPAGGGTGHWRGCAEHVGLIPAFLARNHARVDGLLEGSFVSHRPPGCGHGLREAESRFVGRARGFGGSTGWGWGDDRCNRGGDLAISRTWSGVVGSASCCLALGALDRQEVLCHRSGHVIAVAVHRGQAKLPRLGGRTPRRGGGSLIRPGADRALAMLSAKAKTWKGSPARSTRRRGHPPPLPWLAGGRGVRVDQFCARRPQPREAAPSTADQGGGGWCSVRRRAGFEMLNSWQPCHAGPDRHARPEGGWRRPGGRMMVPRAIS